MCKNTYARTGAVTKNKLPGEFVPGAKNKFPPGEFVWVAKNKLWLEKFAGREWGGGNKLTLARRVCFGGQNQTLLAEVCLLQQPQGKWRSCLLEFVFFAIFLQKPKFEGLVGGRASKLERGGGPGAAEGNIEGLRGLEKVKEACEGGRRRGSR